MHVHHSMSDLESFPSYGLLRRRYSFSFPSSFFHPLRPSFVAYLILCLWNSSDLIIVMQVEFRVNGVEQDYSMKLGEGGEAFFVFETAEDIPASLQTSPLLSPTESPMMMHEGAESSLQEPEFLDLDRPSSASVSSSSIAGTGSGNKEDNHGTHTLHPPPETGIGDKEKGNIPPLRGTRSAEELGLCDFFFFYALRYVVLMVSCCRHQIIVILLISRFYRCGP